MKKKYTNKNLLAMSEKTIQKWQGYSTLIDNWLNERKEMVLFFNQITYKLIAVDHSYTAALETDITRFSEIIIDYISFDFCSLYNEVCEKINESKDNSDHKARIEIGHIFNHLNTNHSQCVNLVEKLKKCYDPNTINAQEISSIVNYINSILVDRFDTEDQFMEILHCYCYETTTMEI